MSPIDPVAVGAEIESIIQRMTTSEDSRASSQARELVQRVMSLYAAGLSRMLDIVRTERGGPDAVLERCAADPLLASLLVLHDLHPHAIEVRVGRALASLQPHLGAHTRVAVIAAGADVVRLQVHRPAEEALLSPEGMRTAIERAVREAAPEVEAIAIEGLDVPLLQIVRPSATTRTPAS